MKPACRLVHMFLSVGLHVTFNHEARLASDRPSGLRFVLNAHFEPIGFLLLAGIEAGVWSLNSCSV